MKIKVGFFALLLFISLVLSMGPHSLIPLFAAVIHEGGHIIAAAILGKRFSRLELSIFGARLNFSDKLLSYGEEFAICFSGPAANLISISLVFGIAVRYGNEHLAYFIISSFFLAVINLFPIKGFDGGRMLFCLAARLISSRSAELIVDILSFFSLFSLWTVSLYLLLRYTTSLSLFVFSVSVFASVFVDEKRYMQI